MNIHEYQARELLARAGIAVPPGVVATTAAEARRAMERLGVPQVVVKAQVHAGGRGKAGGVKLAATPEQAERLASQILGMKIKGLTVTKVLVVPATEIASEAYVGVIVDRVTRSPVFMVSPAGGIDIEEVAAKTPEKIFKATVDARYGLLPHQAMALAFRLYADVAQVRQAADILQRLFRAFVDAGASLAEINPLVVTPKGEVVALDAKIAVDDNELERRPAIEELRDVSAEDPKETMARGANLTYIKLDGNVGCCVNGAGLAMATMDLVKYYGGDPANFLDIGGSSNPEKVVTALKIITADPNVKAILFNIFGGITRCDDVANGIVAATRQFTVDRPLVIRLTGTNEQEAVKILEGVGMRALTDMDAAVEQAVKLAKGGAAA
jgi:succinyl-CoA synthetase beta subunit